MFGLDPEDPCQYVPVRVNRRLVRGQLTASDHLFYDAVVLGQLVDAPLGPIEEVAAGISDIYERDAQLAVGIVADERSRRERCAHAPKVAVGPAALIDGVVGVADGRQQSLCRPVAAVGLQQMLDGDPRRHLPAEVTSHPVGDRGKVARRECQVLVRGS